MVKGSQHDLNCKVAVMMEVATVDHHHRAAAMHSHASDVSFQGRTTCHHLRIGDNMRYIRLVLIHPINDNTEVLGRILLRFAAMFRIFLSLNPIEVQYTYTYMVQLFFIVTTYFSNCMCFSMISLSQVRTVRLSVLSRPSLIAEHTSHLENLVS